MLILGGHSSPVHALAFSPDSWLLASTADDGLFLRTAAGELLWRTPDGPAATYSDLDFAPGGETLSANVAGGLVVFNPAGTTLDGYHGRLPAPAGFLRYVSADLIAVGLGERGKPTPGKLFLYDRRSRQPREPSFVEPHGVRSVASHLPCRTVAWSNNSRRVTVWDIVKPQPVHFPLKHNSPSVAFHPNGTQLAVAQDWGAIVLDITGRREIAMMNGHKGRVSSVAFGPDGNAVATASWDGTVRLWDTQTWAERQAFDWKIGRVSAVAFSPDGTRIAAGGNQGTIAVWDIG